MDTMNGICGINRISPLRGLLREAITFRRALPYANDFGLSAHCIVQKEIMLNELFYN
jgi:hypothetical protein